jgi:serine/threonine-protein kinase HipA
LGPRADAPHGAAARRARRPDAARAARDRLPVTRRRRGPAGRAPLRAEAGGPFLREEGKRIPPLVDLPQLLSAAEHVADDKDTDEELKLLFAPGSSLGGARPKASVIDKSEHLAIAKFPRRDDEYNTVVWEAVALSLVLRAGIEVPTSRIETIDGKQVLLLKRFDREGAHRIPFLSAMSMLGANSDDGCSWHRSAI